MMRPGKLFQPFADEDADVYIVLVQKNLKHIYRIRSHMLIHASSWFRWQLQENFVGEADPEAADALTQDSGIRYRFELTYDSNFKHHVLKRVVSGLSLHQQLILRLYI